MDNDELGSDELPSTLKKLVKTLTFIKIIEPKIVKEKKLNQKLIFIILLGGVAAYSSPPPDATGSFNTSQFDEKNWWEEQTHGILTDGAFGNQDIKLQDVPAYCKCLTF